jgi:hypothetical protein
MKKKRLLILVVIGIGFLGIIYYFFLNTSSVEWRIEVLDLPNIERENPITVQEGLEAPQIFHQSEMRVAAFQIRDPKGGFVFDEIARRWHQKGLIRGYLQGFDKKEFCVLFNDKRIEVWTDSDKFFTAEGEIILMLLDSHGEIIACARAEVIIDNQPPSVDDLK